MKLVRFLMRCTNQTVTISLKNGSSVTGSVAAVDINMNIHLRNVRILNAPSSTSSTAPTETDTLTVRGSTIRTVVLPDSLPLDALLASAMHDQPKNKKNQKSNTTKKHSKQSKQPTITASTATRKVRRLN